MTDYVATRYAHLRARISTDVMDARYRDAERLSHALHEARTLRTRRYLDRIACRAIADPAEALFAPPPGLTDARHYAAVRWAALDQLAGR